MTDFTSDLNPPNCDGCANEGGGHDCIDCPGFKTWPRAEQVEAMCADCDRAGVCNLTGEHLCLDDHLGRLHP